MARIKEYMKKNSFQNILPIRRALLQEANPCLFEYLTTIAGFGIFLTSDFSLNQNFGIYMIIANVAGAIGDLVFLPALLHLFPSILLKRMDLRKPFSWFRSSGATTAVGGFLILSLLVSEKAMGNISANQIMENFRKQMSAKDDQAKIELEVIEKNGSKRMRVMSFKSIRSKKLATMIRIIEPRQERGTALLAEINKGQSSQWIYLSQSKSTRRILGGSSHIGILGSELVLEEMDPVQMEF
jgi:predicted RND superfamily exporter protein